jgi:hypothetical protein
MFKRLFRTPVIVNPDVASLSDAQLADRLRLIDRALCEIHFNAATPYLIEAATRLEGGRS